MDLNGVIDKVSNLPATSLAIALLAVVVTIAYFALASRGLPPGPIGLPILGYWPFLNPETCHLQLDTMKKKYGDVFCFRCTGTLYINLGSVKIMREAQLNKADYFTSRIVDYSLLSYTFEDGVGFCNGEPWKVLRKFFLGYLKERGLISMKENMSDSMSDSIQETVEHLRNANGEPQNIIMFLTDKCNAVFRRTLFGGETGITAEQIREINEYYGVVTECMTATNLLLTGNAAKVLFNVMPQTRNGLKNLKTVEKLIYKIIEEHKSSYNEENIRDMIDEYIKERNLRRTKGDPTVQYFTDKALMASLLQFMGDGVITVAVFVTWILMNAIDRPEEMEKMYKEIVEVVGLERQPTIEDKTKLVYTNAFILEVLRISNLLPFFPSLQCTKETTLRGFRIPVGAVTLINMYSAHNDPEVYEEPQKFNPSRYITKDGAKRAELPISFGIGKRSCLGEGFTMMQVFLFLTTLIKNFHLTKTKEPDNLLSDLFQGKVEIIARPRQVK